MGCHRAILIAFSLGRETHFHRPNRVISSIAATVLPHRSCRHRRELSVNHSINMYFCLTTTSCFNPLHPQLTSELQLKNCSSRASTPEAHSTASFQKLPLEAHPRTSLQHLTPAPHSKPHSKPHSSTSLEHLSLAPRSNTHSRTSL